MQASVDVQHDTRDVGGLGEIQHGHDRTSYFPPASQSPSFASPPSICSRLVANDIRTNPSAVARYFFTAKFFASTESPFA